MTIVPKPQSHKDHFFEKLSANLKLSHYLYLHMNFNSKEGLEVFVKDSKERAAEENKHIIQALSHTENLEAIKKLHEKLPIKSFVKFDLLKGSLSQVYIAKIQHNKVAAFAYRPSTSILDKVQENFLKLHLEMNPLLFKA